MSNKTLRLHLRAQTQQCHVELDSAIGAIETPAAYGRYVRAIHAFRTAAEELLSTPLPPAFEDWRPTILAPLLQADLIDIEESSPAPSSLDMPDDMSSHIGLLYVLEGSALGARVVLKCATDLGFTDTYGARHLARQASSLANWREFLALLEQMPEIDWQLAADGAIATFACARDAVRRADSVSSPVQG
jgi:heme oxygenase